MLYLLLSPSWYKPLSAKTTMQNVQKEVPLRLLGKHKIIIIGVNFPLSR